MEKLLNGHRVHFTIGGKGPWLVLVHSLATDCTAWDAHAAHLSKNFKVLRYDVRGHGRSSSEAPPNTDTYSLELLASDLKILLDHVGADRVHLVGISIGGMISQQFALDYPQYLSSLILVASTSHNPPQAQQAWDKRIATARQQGLEALVEHFLARWFTDSFRETNTAAISRIGKLIAATNLQGFVRACEAIRNINLTAHLHEILVPTLVIVGNDDAGTPPAVSEVIASNIKGSKLVIIPNASHWAPIEQQDAFLFHLNAFLTTSM